MHLEFILNIITIDAKNHSILYQPAEDVTFPLSQTVLTEIETMRVFYKNSQKKSGFAAPQVGISKKIILIEQDLFGGEPSDEPVILIQPEWQPLSDETALDYEGCLSVPGKIGFVERFLHVRLTAWQYQHDTGLLTHIERDYHQEFACALWQHEIDHLHGKIYVDKATLLLEEDEIELLQQYLIHTKQWKQNTSFFDAARLLYSLAKAYKETNASHLHTFLMEKLNS
jgi:peptide deformylase